MWQSNYTPSKVISNMINMIFKNISSVFPIWILIIFESIVDLPIHHFFLSNYVILNKISKKSYVLCLINKLSVNICFFVVFKDYFIFSYVNAWLWVYVHVYRFPRIPQTPDYHGSWVRDSCDLSEMDVGNLTLIMCMRNTCF